MSIDDVSMARLTGGTSTEAQDDADTASLEDVKAEATRSWVHDSELLAARIQLAVMGMLTALFLFAPAPVDRESTVTTYTAQILLVLLALSVLRWVVPRDMTYKQLMLGVLSVGDALMLCVLVYSYHVQYEIPLAAVLKAPTFGYFFFMLALRSISLQSINVYVTGVGLTVGWGALTALAAAQTPPIGGFVQYVTSDTLLIGAEVDRCMVLILTTGVLGLGVHRIHKLLRHMDSLSAAAQKVEVDDAQQRQFRQVSAKVAHEIRNPLNAIHASVLVLARKASANGEQVGKPLARVTNSIERCERVINDMMEFSSAAVRDRSVVDFDDWLEEILNAGAEQIPNDVRLELHRGTKGAKVSVDRNQLSNAVDRLIVNAVEAIELRYSKPGSVGSGRIIVETRLVKKQVRLAIIDNGVGMDTDEIERVRQPLVTSKGFGVGLGLPIAQRVIEAHGGSLSIHSEPDKGTRVEMFLPPHDPSENEAD